MPGREEPLQSGDSLLRLVRPSQGGGPGAPPAPEAFEPRPIDTSGISFYLDAAHPSAGDLVSELLQNPGKKLVYALPIDEIWKLGIHPVFTPALLPGHYEIVEIRESTRESDASIELMEQLAGISRYIGKFDNTGAML